MAQERFARYNQKNFPPSCSLKVDLRKAFDSMEWDFLEASLRLFKFPSRFRSWIMECISMVSYFIYLNGGVHGYFQGARGLRQEALEEFGHLSGLYANPSKSQLLLSKSAATTASDLLPVLNFQLGSLPVKYLGLPLVSSKLSVADCRFLLLKLTSASLVGVPFNSLSLLALNSSNLFYALSACIGHLHSFYQKV
ncbi:UNVERIFIED_CONTAM: hypothetical protein Slati_2689800 [Sesamum latifolium]|uniref:Reverse transcriptase domain-containing protein n=1 Tax=Sesamum latifolium TaxID=2727402 RepID=A0AAW2VVP6_9LAMI